MSELQLDDSTAGKIQKKQTTKKRNDGKRQGLHQRKGAFANAEQNLRNMGFSPVNPFKNGLPDEAHWREHMRADIALLLDCEYIYMLKDWELSKGAKLELDVASSCGIKVLFE